jgi:hypothetical protein
MAGPNKTSNCGPASSKWCLGYVFATKLCFFFNFDLQSKKIDAWQKSECGKPNDKPTIWGWFIRSIYAEIEMVYGIGFTICVARPLTNVDAEFRDR